MKVKIEEVVQTTNIERKKQAEATIAEFAVQHLAIEKSVMDAAGDLVKGTGADAYTKLARGTAGQVLATNDAGTDIEWKTLETGGGSATLTNKSGSNQSLGAVVVIEPSFDSAFTTTTAAGDKRNIGILGEAIDNNQSGKVLVGGQSATVLVQGNVSRGHWLRTSTTAGRAESAGYTKPHMGWIGVAITEYTGGGAGSVTAILIPGGFNFAPGPGKLHRVGSGSSPYTQHNKYLFTSETESALSAITAGPYYYAATVSEGDTLYKMGGSNGSGQVATCSKVSFATDTFSSLSNTISVARYAVLPIEEDTVGYAWGGYTGAIQDRVDKFTYSTETSASLGGKDYKREYTSGQNSSRISSGVGKTYLCGAESGYDGTVHRVVHSTEVWTGNIFTRSPAAHAAGTVFDASADKGYLCGGSYSTGSTNICDKIDLSAETMVGAGFTTTTAGRHWWAGYNDTYGYVKYDGGGYPDRIDYAAGTLSQRTLISTLSGDTASTEAHN